MQGVEKSFKQTNQQVSERHYYPRIPIILEAFRRKFGQALGPRPPNQSINLM